MKRARDMHPSAAQHVQEVRMAVKAEGVAKAGEGRRREQAQYWVYFDGEFKRYSDARLGLMTHALHYGTGVFEGLRAYWNAEHEQLFILKPREHYERMHRSARVLMLKIPLSVDELCAITVELVRKNGFRQDAYIRPIAFKSSEEIGVRLHNLNDSFAIYVTPFGSYVDIERGIRCMVSSWRRIDDNVAPARAKITGIYVNSALAKTEAMENGFDEAIMLSQDGHVCEGSAENLFIVRANRVFTPPAQDNILEGITRENVIELLRTELGVEVVERSIDRSELYVADEVFLCGTGAQIAPVIEVDHRAIGSGQVGPIASRLQALYFDIVRGRNPKYADWLTPVY
jgi:branched-chain amino acid aminotransferase